MPREDEKVVRMRSSECQRYWNQDWTGKEKEHPTNTKENRLFSAADLADLPYMKQRKPFAGMITPAIRPLNVRNQDAQTQNIIRKSNVNQETQTQYPTTSDPSIHLLQQELLHMESKLTILNRRFSQQLHINSALANYIREHSRKSDTLP